MSRFIPHQIQNFEPYSFFRESRYPPISDDQKLTIYREVREKIKKEYDSLCVRTTEDEYSKTTRKCQELWDLLYSIG